ncbi:uncharacterized protein LOC108222810 isoform X2 [Daucus carota subsp. sativus]|uniref:uncharacterized protein LOC108222810 isoform X2 n=1 Tax=Daucus carota subsp. sativus TaxID=79200 RepID=UPI003082C2E0
MKLLQLQLVSCYCVFLLAFPISVFNQKAHRTALIHSRGYGTLKTGIHVQSKWSLRKYTDTLVNQLFLNVFSACFHRRCFERQLNPHFSGNGLRCFEIELNPHITGNDPSLPLFLSTGDW